MVPFANRNRSGAETRRQDPGRIAASGLTVPPTKAAGSYAWLPGSDRPGALRRRALLRTGLATFTASGSSNVRRVWQSQDLRSVRVAGGSSAGPLTPAVGRGV